MAANDQSQDMPPSFIEGVKEGISDSEAGRVSSLEDVVERLQPVPDEAKLMNEEIYQITSVHPRFVKQWPGAQALADAATEKAVAYIRETEGVEWRVQMLREVARFKVEETKVAQLQKQLEGVNGSLSWRDEELITALKERDAALEQVRALVKAGGRAANVRTQIEARRIMLNAIVAVKELGRQTPDSLQDQAQ